MAFHLNQQLYPNRLATECHKPQRPPIQQRQIPTTKLDPPRLLHPFKRQVMLHPQPWRQIGSLGRVPAPIRQKESKGALVVPIPVLPPTLLHLKNLPQNRVPSRRPTPNRTQPQDLALSPALERYLVLDRNQDLHQDLYGVQGAVREVPAIGQIGLDVAEVVVAATDADLAHPEAVGGTVLEALTEALVTIADVALLVHHGVALPLRGTEVEDSHLDHRRLTDGAGHHRSLQDGDHGLRSIGAEVVPDHRQLIMATY